jgi:hypothetical protein
LYHTYECLYGLCMLYHTYECLYGLCMLYHTYECLYAFFYYRLYPTLVVGQIQ